MEIISGFLMGILGSFHCLGMCGPLILVIPSRGESKAALVLDSFLYNFGRTLTYTVMGALVGLIGASLSFAGYQESISIIAGAALLLVVLLPKKWENGISQLPIINSIGKSFKKLFGKILGTKSAISVLLLGLLNGLLPCGLVYVALTASIAGGSVQSASTFMFFFGLGTIPMLAAVYVLKSMLSLGIRRKITKLIPVGIAVVAIILILRGLSLGIPYVSPHLPEHVQGKAACCQHEK